MIASWMPSPSTGVTIFALFQNLVFPVSSMGAPRRFYD
jgi:hypothetical protein